MGSGATVPRSSTGERTAYPPSPSARPASVSPSEGTQQAESRRPINPFLANDPAAKARRLARALVSDIVTYYPDKQREGVEHGTLKILFKDEIKKSYEEYADQVGKEFAEDTTHFRQALNEILARGQEVF
jgi:hypothetical protein